MTNRYQLMLEQAGATALDELGCSWTVSATNYEPVERAQPLCSIRFHTGNDYLVIQFSQPVAGDLRRAIIDQIKKEVLPKIN